MSTTLLPPSPPISAPPVARSPVRRRSVLRLPLSPLSRFLRGARHVPIAPAVRLAFLSWLGWIAAWIAFSVFAIAYSASDVEGPAALIPHPLADTLSRWTLWDGYYFIGIAQGGYTHGNLAAFYPLYPLLIHAGLWLARPLSVIPAPFVAPLVALAVDQLAALAALIGLALLAVEDARRRSLAPGEGVRLARWTLAALLAYPLAFFLLAAYSDALFLALAVWAIYSARRRRWILAAAIAILAGLARPVAPALAVPLAVEYVAAVDWRELRAIGGKLRIRIGVCGWHALAALDMALSACFGMLLYMAYAQRHYGSAYAPTIAERHDFGRILAGPWTGVQLAVKQWPHLPALSYTQLRWLTDMAPLAVCVLVALALAVLAALALAPAIHRGERIERIRARIRRAGASWPISYTAYLAGLSLLILCTPVTIAEFPDAYAGAGRFVLAAFPLALLAGRVFARWPSLGRAACVAGMLAQAVLAAYVLRGGWLI